MASKPMRICKGALYVPLFLLVVGLSTGLSTCRRPVKPASLTRSVEELKSQWGIDILGIRWTAAGYMLDFRFRVIDPCKAAPLFVRKTKPYLIDERTGARLVVPNPPKVGPLRTSDKPQKGRVYFIMFANPGKLIKPGQRVTIVIGKFRVQGLIVQ